MKIFTIGHSNYTVEKLIHMLRHYNIDCVVDIRGTPYSKYNIQFDKETIRETLKKEGFIYIYMAKELAAKRENRISYYDEGYSDFEKVVYEEDFIKGIQRLKDGCEKGYRIALLGAMQDPIRCHRSILVGRALRDHGFTVGHILDDYSLAFSDRDQVTIDTILGTAPTEKELIEEGYRLANKEIGYRIEHLK